MPNAPSDGHGWPSVAGAKDGGKRPWRSWRQCTSAGHGWPSVPVAKDGEKGPCALPRVWGRSLERKFASLLT
ncbi:hypothetical protein [Desulfosporosinus metallidurans]|uniref:hypothetical protein n=1 Tax=Desulfosporosinus metallidurans TaxID=1888891 RepID=UPI0011152BBC|nr:hypothetical protein [Desulfosporosinus metallidurans]